MILKSRFHEFSYSMLTLNLKVTEDNLELPVARITDTHYCTLFMPCWGSNPGLLLARQALYQLSYILTRLLDYRPLSKDEMVFCYGFGLHFSIVNVAVGISFQYLYFQYKYICISSLVRFFKLGYHYY